MPATKAVVDPERLEELRAVLAKLPGSENRAWLLEVYDLRDGHQVLKERVDIRTGRRVKRRQSRQAQPA